MEFLHTMVRITNIDASIDFYCNKLGLVEFSRKEYEKGKFTLIFLCAPDDLKLAEQNRKPLLELTYNWDKESYTGGRNFGHLAFSVQNIYETCQKLLDNGVIINRPPRDGHMAFIKGDSLEPQEPWLSMENSGSW